MGSALESPFFKDKFGKDLRRLKNIILTFETKQIRGKKILNSELKITKIFLPNCQKMYYRSHAGLISTCWRLKKMHEDIPELANVKCKLFFLIKILKQIIIQQTLLIGSKNGDGTCYYWGGSLHVDYEESKEFCKNLKLHLPEPRNEAQRLGLKQIMVDNSIDEVWLGFEPNVDTQK